MMINTFYKKIFSNLNSSEIFFTHYKEKYTYKDLKNFCLKLFNTLGFLKNKRNKICIISEKSFELYATSFGVVLSNNIWVPISQSSPLERIFEITNDLKPDLFIFDNVNTLKMLRLKNFLKKKELIFFYLMKLNKLNQLKDFLN